MKVKELETFLRQIEDKEQEVHIGCFEEYHHDLLEAIEIKGSTNTSRCPKGVYLFADM